MKSKLFLTFAATIFAVLALGPIGLLALANLLSYGVSPFVIGASYPVPAAQTRVGLVALTSKAQEELWVRKAVIGTNPSIDETPFADNMIGRVIEGKPSDNSKLRKAVIEVIDTQKVRGQTINIPTYAALGGEGAHGETQRLGTEAPYVVGNMQLSIGRAYFGAAVTTNAIDETVIGSTYMENFNLGLRALHNRKKSNSIMMRMRQVADSSSANLLFPDGASSRATLLSNHIVDTSLINKGGFYLPGIGAMPMDTTRDKAGSVGRLYMFLSTDRALQNLGTEPAYLTNLQFAAERGDGNPVFEGGFQKYNGHGIYRWVNSDHANNYAIGSMLLPRAKLGLALTAADATTVIHGGNSNGYTAETATFKPNWFEFFSNAPWTFYGSNSNIVADVATTRYLVIKNQAGTYGYYTYQVNDGNKITILAKYTRAVTGMNESDQVRDHTVGAEVIEVNALGVPFGRSLMFGAQAVAAGIGRVQGTPTDPEMGMLIDSWLDQKRDRVIGIEAAWGCSAVSRAGDGAYPNFVVIEHAVPYPGLPTITSTT